MTVSRRGLLKALGLGGVGLAVGGASMTPIQEMVAAKEGRLEGGLNDMLNDQRPLTVRKAPHWEHPEMDRIEAIFKLTGGYPKMWGNFVGDVSVCNGDRLNIDYVISSDYMDNLVLYRVFDAVAACHVIGSSIQGPVVRDHNAPDGHRLATIDELVPNEEASVRDFGRIDADVEARISQLF